MINRDRLQTMALHAGKKQVSSQTGFYHLFYHALPEEHPLTIPLYENFLYALALFNVRQMDQVTEGKHLLERLLHFQNKEEGFFPTYVHEYPFAQDSYFCINYFAPLFWIEKEYGHILGQELKKKVFEAVVHLFLFFENLMRLRDVPYLLKVKYFCALQAFGTLWGNKEWQEEATKSLEKLANGNEEAAWVISQSIGEIIVHLQMIYKDLFTSPWSKFIDQANSFWHTHLQSYVGPCWMELSQNFETKPTLYDYIFNQDADMLSSRLKVEQPLHLQLVLIQPISKKVIPSKRFVKGVTEGLNWDCLIDEKYALSAIQKNKPIAVVFEKGFTPFRMVFGNLERQHSLIFQNLNCSEVLTSFEDGIYLDFILNHDFDVDDRDKQKEIVWYWDIAKESTFLVEAHTANVFHLNDTIQFTSDNFAWEFSFSTNNKENKFVGHVIRQNRLAQTQNKGIKKFDCYDWMGYIRTVARDPESRLRINLKLL
ncbi:MAG: hypothetical protein BGO10_04880 [Chlamydia sp. 32-24]|nr:MAG: hypothetical protein BGO10_04880 [Chlamydia sp. 32-24]